MDKIKTDSKYPPFKFGWTDGLVLIAGMIIVMFVLGIISTGVLLTTGTNLQYNQWFVTLMNVLPLLGSIVMFDFVVVRPKYKKPLNFNFSSTNFYTYVLVFPMMFGMMMVGEFFTNLVPTTGPIFGNLYEQFNTIFKGMMNEPYLMFFMLVISAPILEEIIFRGIIQKGLIRGGMGYKSAIFISAVLFGLVHGNPWQFIGALLLGSLLGVVYYKTKTLLVPILLHAFNNAVSYFMIMYTDVESFADLFKVSSVIILGIGLILFGIFYYLFTRKYKVHYSEL